MSEEVSQALDVVRSGGGEVSVSEMHAIVMKVQDAVKLREVSAQAAAVSIYERRRRNLRKAKEMQALVVFADAALGILDIADTPRLSPVEPWVIGEHVVTSPTRLRLRMFAVSEMRGMLRSIVGDLMAKDMTVGSSWVTSLIRGRGAPYAPWKPVETLIKRHGIDRDRLEGLPNGRDLLVAMRGRPDHVKYLPAKEVFEMVGADPMELPPLPVILGPRESQRQRARGIAIAKNASIGELYSMVERFQDVLAKAEIQAENDAQAFREIGPVYRQMRDLTVRAVLLNG